ncbi:MAG TPA: LON peptidase substrate-binding domain-containing protein [Thermoleophilaceae bacterium]
MGEFVSSFPLFPLGIVLLPEEVVPLHIFEERYKLMIGECLEYEREFGIVWLSDSGLRDVGCTATISELLETMDDGRMNILVRGTRPFRLVRRIEELPYPAGDIELLDDDGAAPEPAALEDTRERYAELVERLTESRPDAAQLDGLGAYGIAATIDFAHDAKQSLLESRSESERLGMLSELIDAAMKRVDYVERAGERAKSNGKIRFQ